MKNNATTPSSIDYRAQILHNACKRISELVSSGAPIGRIIASEARKQNGAPIGGGRYLKLSAKSLTRHWYAWKSRRDPAVFAPKLKIGERAKFDPVLIGLVIHHSLQTCQPLTDAIDWLRKQGNRISIRDLYRIVNAGAMRSFTESHKRMVAHRKTLERQFLQSLARLNREFLKQHRSLVRRVVSRSVKEDARLRARMLCQREFLQKKFLASDARAVRQREKLQRKVFKHLL